jgi:non-ribosomal peptide synthetase component E (peptide arylation enzyme)
MPAATVRLLIITPPDSLVVAVAGPYQKPSRPHSRGGRAALAGRVVRSRGTVGRTMIVDSIGKWARTHPDKVALIHNDVPMNYAAFARTIEGARRHLSSLGLPPRQTAIVRAPNLRDSWVVVLALRVLGLNTVSVQSIAQGRALQLPDVVCVVTTDAEHERDDIDALGTSGVRHIVVPAAVLAGVGAGDLPPNTDISTPVGGHILHTSGSTGARKKVFADGALEDKANEMRARVLLYGPQSVHHGLDYGLWTGVGYKQSAAAWHSGGCVVFDQRTDNTRNFFAHGVNRARLLPPILRSVLDAADPSRGPREDLDIGTGGVLFPLDLAQATVSRLTRNFKIVYSATELCVTPLQTLFRTAEDIYWLAPTDDRVLQVVDEEGRECAPEEEGMLRIGTTPLDGTAYIGEPEMSARAFRDGFFYPGDLAAKRADGRVRILGRVDDVINVGGQKIAAGPVEQSLQQNLRVAEVCLFTREIAEGRQELVIAIETDRELPPYELDAVTAEFRGFDRVRVSVLREFPRTDTGTRKTRRSELKKLVFAQS